jgi:hypothetical protein
MDLREAIEAFVMTRGRVAGGRELPHLERVKYFGGHVREPHFCPDYREIRERELELNGGVDYGADYQLLSVWRLARDPDYPRWAREIGTRKCQVSLCGLESTNDWFYRRKGAHADVVAATLRMIEHGIQPRWQVFLTRRGLPELPGLLRLVDELRLRERLGAAGLDFELFLNDATPLGEARALERERLRAADVPFIPRELVEATERYTAKPFGWATEADWIAGFLREPDRPIGLDYPGELWFFVTPSWDVYSNAGSLEPWWRLASCPDHDLSRALPAFLQDRAPALRSARELTVHHACRSYGDPRSDRVWLSGTDLWQGWLERHCERPEIPRPA